MTSLDYLIDSNILVFSVDRSSPFHTDTVNALEVVLRAGNRLSVTAQNLIEFWNVCTRPVDRNGLGLFAAETDREISRLEQINLSRVAPLGCGLWYVRRTGT